MYALKAIITSGIYVQVIFGVLIFGIIMMVAMAFSKRKKLAYINSYITEFEKTFWSGISLDQFYESNKENLSHPLGLIFKGVMDEWNACAAFRNNIGSKTDVKERMLNIAHIKKIETMKVCENYLDILRLFIHGAPFLGLLGTIMILINVFYNVDLENGLTITTTGKGIASSLVCIMFSIFDVIVAMGIHFVFDRKAQKVSDKMDAFIVDFLNILTRSIDANTVGGSFLPAPVNMPQMNDIQQVEQIKRVQSVHQPEPAQEEPPKKKPKPASSDI